MQNTNTTSFKELPVGNESFKALRENNCYYVDKTAYLKTVFQDPASVLLITRPRRFGKTLLMSMFDAFLRISKDGSPNHEHKLKLFDNLEILKDTDFVEKFMGKFPVLSISLKNVCGTTFKEAYEKLAQTVVLSARDFSYLCNSTKLSSQEKSDLNKLFDQDYLCDLQHKTTLTAALETLSISLYKHFGRQVILLIDEYDVPLAKASENGYHQEMVSLISAFYNVMKISPANDDEALPAVAKIVLTGCLKVAKNSIFTGVNNFEVNSVLSANSTLAAIMGFTNDETFDFLKAYSLQNYLTLVKENYDGYRFNDKEIFCPWDIVCFIKDTHIKKQAHQEDKIVAENFWANTSSNNALLSYVGYLSEQENTKLQQLMDGLSIETSINDSMNYDDLKMHRSEDFFSLLLQTGYLTIAGIKQAPHSNSKLDIFSLKIPNLEIRECFASNIVQHFNEVITKDQNLAHKLANTLLQGDNEQAGVYIHSLLQKYVSIRDFATKAKSENFYHGFMSGILANCGNFITDFKSNKETGLGYADICFKNAQMTKAVLLELKATNNLSAVKKDALNAIEQIVKKDYTQEYLGDPFIKDIFCYGLAFYKKQCWIEVKKLKKA